MEGGRTFFLDLTAINIRTLRVALLDEMLSLYAYIKNSNLFNMKLKNTPQFCNHVWICRLLEYSRTEMAEVSQHWEVLLILVTPRTLVFALFPLASLEEIPVSSSQKVWWNPGSVSTCWNSTNFSRTFFWIFWDRRHHALFNFQDTEMVCLSVLCLCLTLSDKW